MEKNSAFGSFNNTLLLQTQNLHCSSQVLDSFWNSGFSPPFKGSASMVNFHNPPQETREGYIASLDIDENNGEFYDQPEKKRRLTKDQVQFLEKSFEVENKLEPERKVQLAKDTGLQPRQVSIWYQNRRARYRTKQLEKDYDSMKETYKRLKVDYDKLFKQNENLRNEVEFLKETIFVGDKMKTINSLDLEATRHKQIILGKASDLQVMVCKQEDTNNSDKLHCGEGNLKSISDSIDSSSILETDFSHDDQDTFRRIMLPPNPMKLETESFDNLYLDDDHYNLESSAEDEPFLLWTDQLYL